MHVNDETANELDDSYEADGPSVPTFPSSHSRVVDTHTHTKSVVLIVQILRVYRQILVLVMHSATEKKTTIAGVMKE